MVSRLRKTIKNRLVTVTKLFGGTDHEASFLSAIAVWGEGARGRDFSARRGKGRQFGETEIDMIVGIVHVNTQLVTLRLVSLPLNPISIIILGAALCKAGRTLRHLELVGNGIGGEEGSIQLWSNLSDAKCVAMLERLVIKSNGVRIRPLEARALWTTQKQLQIFDLTGNGLSDEGARDIASALRAADELVTPNSS